MPLYDPNYPKIDHAAISEFEKWFNKNMEDFSLSLRYVFNA